LACNQPHLRRQGEKIVLVLERVANPVKIGSPDAIIFTVDAAILCVEPTVRTGLISSEAVS